MTLPPRARFPLNTCCLSLGLLMAASASPALAQAQIQGGAVQPAQDATKPADATAPTAKPAAPAPAPAPQRPQQQRPTATLKPVEIVGTDETEQRRLSTAAKIIIGRDDIERYGDTTMGELLKRLPGITIQGRPGRGGAPRMRGLGSGYTQILLDGERVPRGFSLDDLQPDQIERIEILRAPTAETGARAIAGTINIITRGGYTKHVNNINLGLGLENGHEQPSIGWSRNDTVDNLIYNFSVAATHNERSNDIVNTTLTENLSTGQVTNQSEATHSTGKRDGIHANARLQWRLDGGDQLQLMPMFVATQNSGGVDRVLTETGGPAPYDYGTGSANSHFYTLRLAGLWLHRMEGGANLRLSASLGHSEWENNSLRENFGGLTPPGGELQNQHSEQRDNTLNLNAKYTRLIAEQHSLVTGIEFESNQRNEIATTLLNGESPLSDFDGNLTASTQRKALYAQDEWNLTPHWAAHAGLRWEGIDTSGSVGDGQPNVTNHSGVTTPLVHAVYRPDLESKDQIRFSLTRSYRSPNLQDLIARPNINGTYLNRGANDEVHADTAGNPYLKPELARGLDVAFEHYVPGGGILSANVFYRHIQDLMRTVTTLETVSWADVPRWVARKQNIGDATTAGIELEAKFRLSEMFPNMPRIDIRSNASFFRSNVEGIIGPNNRLDQQPPAVANLGADYKLSSAPVTIGGNINWNPDFTTQQSNTQTLTQSTKVVSDAYLLWTISPTYQLRLSANNFAPRQYITGGVTLSTNPQNQALRETTQAIAPSFVAVQVRLEIKL
jgi:iron complex outermembrane receptor protein